MIGDAARDLAAQLTAAGVEAYADAEASMTFPCALVTPKRIAYDRLAAAPLTIEWSIVLLVGDYSPLDALDRLGELLATIADAMPVGEVEPIMFPLTSGSVPALVFTLTTEVS